MERLNEQVISDAEPQPLLIGPEIILPVRVCPGGAAAESHFPHGVP